MSDPKSVLLARWADITAIGAASAVLGWDQETCMPPKGQPGRGRALAALAGLNHEKLTDKALSDAIEAVEVEAAASGDGDMAAQAREARRTVTRAVAVPAELARRLAETQSRALASWQQARAADDFGVFAPDLRELVTLTFEEADAYVDAGIAATRYDAMLDGFEPGATEARIAPILASLRAELSPLIRAVAETGDTVDETCCRGAFDEAAQLALGREIAMAMGYDLEAGRLDTSAHPFTTGFNNGDVRITWRCVEDDFRPGLFGIMHEAGHALYEQGLPDNWQGTPIGGSASLGVHESQSRLWENLVGRRRSFWQWALPLFTRNFPDKAGVTVGELWPALHTVTPSLIRVEADEATYNLHIVARFEIERALFAGDITVDDLPGLWSDTYQALLGVRPGSAADGVLQDIHWSMGAFGYFPTYTLGNLLASQLFEAATRSLGGEETIDGLLSAGELDPLLGWLRDNVHAHASRLRVTELVEQATGSPLTSDAFMRHIRSGISETYGIAT